MPFNLAAVNIWAILVAALIAFITGAVWYTALFGKLWIRMHGFSEEKVKQMQSDMSPPLFFGGMLLSYLVLAAALALLISAAPKTTAASGIAYGLLFWLGSSAVAMTGHIASDKRLGVYLIDTGCQLVYLIAIGALLGAWR